MSSNSPVKGLKIRGRAQSNTITPGKPSHSELRARNHKAAARKRQRKKKLNQGEPVDLDRSDVATTTTPVEQIVQEVKDDSEVEADLELSFVGAEDLASPEAGPSRLPFTTPSTFTPLPRSVLAGITRSRSSTPDRLSSPIIYNEVDIIVDQQPAATAARPDPAPPPVSDHFQPPAIFSATLDEINLETSQPINKDTGSEVSPADDGAKSTLLLPANVVLDDVERIQGPDDTNRGDDTMEGLHFVDGEISKGVQRYFDGSAGDSEEATFLANADQSRICTTCKRPGHKQWNCPHIICTVCGAEDEHERRDCPHSLVCFGCGQRGHKQVDCPDPVSRNSRKRGCDRCGSREHPESNCPTVWRVYAYWSSEERTQVQTKKRTAEGWEKEATGGGEDEQWCYNCALEGHLGDDCPRSRGSFAKLFFPSAFSHAMSSRGPFYIADPSGSRSGATPTHARWDDNEDLPLVMPGFQGGNAGKHSRDKARRALIDREKGANNDEEEDDWFAGSSRPNSNTPRGRGNGRNAPRRPWDSDSKRHDKTPRGSGLPFGHGHLMGSAPPAVRGKGISFGTLTLPTGESDSPSTDKPKKRIHTNGLLAKALEGSRRSNDATPSSRKYGEGGTPLSGKQRREGRKDLVETPTLASLSTPTSAAGSKKKKRKQAKEEEERDLESQWWSSGNAGGNVSSWGKDMASPSTGGARKKGAKGQQYVGGY